MRLLEYGGPLVLNDVPTPTIARDEILAKIRNTAVNHLDLLEAPNGKQNSIEPNNCSARMRPPFSALPISAIEARRQNEQER
jgi:hypothetical protein